MKQFLIYGANGYTGELIAREAVKRGMRPILAGRNETLLAMLAQELGLEHRVCSLDQPAQLIAALQDIHVVLNCAGPFMHTAQLMVNACLQTKTHYLDITGEYAVIEVLAQCDAAAKAAGIMVLPAAGFDVVPSDCLAAHLKQRLPTATKLTIGLMMEGGVSRGTSLTIVENLHRGGVVRHAGRIIPVPTAWKTRQVDFGSGARTVTMMPLADVASAFYTTQIPNIAGFVALPLMLRFLVTVLRPFTWLMGTAFIQRFLKARIIAGKAGPTDAERALGKSHVWGEATDDAGRVVVSRLHGPDGYTFTMLSSLAIIEQLLQHSAPIGFQTPATALGPEFVLGLAGVSREDVVSIE